MALDVDAEVAGMQQMTVSELRAKFAQVCGEATNVRNKPCLIKRIAWRMQANEFGGLSERALQRAKELANFADLRLTAPRAGTSTASSATSLRPSAPKPQADKRLPMPGTIITREYKGRTVQVQVADDGFEYDGQRYKSLSAVAKAVTGAHWNGFLFFGLSPESAA
jgi:hypothetical protein